MLAVIIAASMSSVVFAQTVTWSGGNTTWTQPDSDSWTSATYQSGNTALFNGAGTGTVTIDAGGVTPGQVNVTAGSYTFSGGGIGGSGGIAKSGAGTLTLSAANTYSGSTSVTAGVLNIQNATALGGTAAGTTVSSLAAIQLQGGITVSGESLSLSGGGIASDGALRNMSGTNTWAGSVSVDLLGSVSSGLGSQNRIQSDTSSRLVISGPVSIAAGSWNGTAGTAAAIILQGNGNGEITGNITGGVAGVLTLARGFNGSGAWTLSGSNSYLGYTAVNNNELIAAGGFAIPDTSLTYFLNAGRLTLNANETIGSVTSDTTSAVINLNANTLTIGADNSNPVDPSGQTAFRGSIIGTGGIVKVGTGLLTLSGSSSFTGGTTLNAGVLSFANNALGSSGAVTLNSGTLRWASGNTQDISGRLTLVSGSTATLDTGANNVTLASGFGGSTTAALTKVGSGTLTLSAATTYTGTTSINAGTLALTGAGALASTGAVNNTASGATLDISGITAAGLTIGSLSGSAGSVVTLGGKSLTVGNASSTTFAGGIGGSGGIIKQGAGTLALTAASTYSGLTSITAGAITIQNATALGSTAAGTTVSSGATLQIQGGITVSGESLSIAGGGNGGALRNISGTNTWAGSVSVTLTGSVSGGVGSPNRVQSDTSSRLVISGPVSIAAGTWNGSAGTSAALILQGDGTGEISGNITGGVAGALTVARGSVGSGAWTLSGSNSYLGYTTANGNELIVSGGFAIPDTSLTYLGGTGRLTLNSSETIGSLTSNTTSSVVDLNANTLTIGADNSTPTDPNGSSSYQGSIIGTGSIVKVGTGRLTLSGSTSYSGATIVKGGTLALGLNGSLGSSPTITVGDAGSSGAVLDLTAKTGTFAFTSGQTVGGIGTLTIGTGKTVSVAGIWSPGNSIGSNTVTGNLSLSGTSQFELGTPGTSTSAPGTSDFTAVSGTLTLGGALTLLDNAGADGNGSAAGGVYRLFTYGSAVSGSYASVTTNPTATTRTSLSNISYGGSGTGAGQGVFLSVYNLAAGSIASGTTVNFGTVLKNTLLSQNLSITNTATNNAFSEKLGTAFGAATGLASGSGSWSLLSAGGTSTALSVYLSSGSAGPASGSQTVNYTSDGTGSSGLSAVGVGSQTVNLSATILDPAVASFGAGPSASASLTLDFLTVNQGDVVSPQNFNIYNLLQTAGYTADLALLSITPAGGNSAALTTNLATFNSLASGTFNTWQASVNTASQGTFSNTWTLAFKSSNGGTAYSGDATQSLTLTANVIVVPEPAAIALAGIGIAAAALACRRSRRASSP